MSKAAMKLALEALEVATTPLAKDRQEVLRAQAAIREALAEQPAQQEQEPFCYHDGRNIVGKEFADHSDVFPLYTSPPASKPWVGLTDEEWQEIDASLNGKRDLARIFTRAIEAKLKEKNT